MDPNLFAVDSERLFEVLGTIIVLSFLLERCLSLVFEHRLYLATLDQKGFKEPIAFALAFGVCRQWDFDALSIILVREHVTLFGEVITAGVIAGGSKASIKLFHDVFKSMSSAQVEAKALKAAAKG